MQQPTLCSSSGLVKRPEKSGLFLAEDVVKTCYLSRTKYDGVDLCTSLSSVRLSQKHKGLRRVPTLKPFSRTTVIFISLFTSVACETLHWLKMEKKKNVYIYSTCNQRKYAKRFGIIFCMNQIASSFQW